MRRRRHATPLAASYERLRSQPCATDAVAPRRATLPQPGALHILRHTFCSRLVMVGAPVRAIQEAAGHADLSTTMRYMHLAPTARGDAIRLLDGLVAAPIARATIA